MKRRAFTLIELLVVIATISILATILFPVFARARENARRASCQSNLKQIGIATLMYTQDYDERLPNVWIAADGVGKTGGWMYYSVFGSPGINAAFDPTQSSLYPYLKSAQVFICPSDTQGSLTKDSYAINSCTETTTAVTGFVSGKSLAAFDDVSLWMLYSEEGSLNGSTDDAYQLLGVNSFSDRHLDGSNITFLDGHVKWYKTTTISTDYLQTGGQISVTCP